MFTILDPTPTYVSPLRNYFEELNRIGLDWIELSYDDALATDRWVEDAYRVIANISSGSRSGRRNGEVSANNSCGCCGRKKVRYVLTAKELPMWGNSFNDGSAPDTSRYCVHCVRSHHGHQSISGTTATRKRVTMGDDKSRRPRYADVCLRHPEKYQLFRFQMYIDRTMF